MRIICKKKPYRFEDKYWIFGFQNEWFEMFEDREFDVYIFQNRLYIRSEPVKQ
ncbi:hypothetical protein SCCGRSA3_01553 [Marine Group I thaumarchaeote SCGC RSA3]|uniref:Uncharacterized protein n=1 Tax=Marine Group I thaumarchaeote SCGC RSA3 TaxID=1503183 RepID=A0A087RVW9_9ARCH|nr:hypothetical protein SCCGRSA3_01553 [Marine Group I thaumarchaeote SCGC RSA3]